MRRNINMSQYYHRFNIKLVPAWPIGQRQVANFGKKCVAAASRGRR